MGMDMVQKSPRKPVKKVTTAMVMGMQMTKSKNSKPQELIRKCNGKVLQGAKIEGLSKKE